VSRAHDIGGQTGFGPVPRGDDGQPFAADWEARVYALNAVLRRRDLYDTDQMRDALEQIPPQTYLAASYYERWLMAIEALLADRVTLAQSPGDGG
jgi:nitrile hydratase